MKTRSANRTRANRALLGALGLLASACSSPKPEAETDELTRDEVADAEKWNLADLYRDDAAWTQAKEAIAARIPELEQMRAVFGRSAADMLEVLLAIDEVHVALERVEVYAMSRADQDTRDAEAQALVRQLDVVVADFAAATAWLHPAVLELGRARVDAYLAQEQGLAAYRQPLDDILRRAPHTLSPEAEKILADSSLIADSAENIYTILSSADIEYPTVRLSTGEEVELTQAAYTKYRETPDRDDRIKVFEAFWKVFEDYSRTFSVSLDAGVKRDVFYARARNYDSALESALDEPDVPIAVYENIIADAHEHLPTLHRYLELRARVLGIDELAYHDLYVPLVESAELRYGYAEAMTLVQEGLAPLGPEYGQVLETALGGRWIDVRPTAGKVSGGYMADAYGVHPYILLNYNGTYQDVSTLAHELGHALHSHFTNEHQPYATSRYSILLAEVASITNEALLIHRLLEEEEDPKVRLFLLGSHLESLRISVFRQALFAEFELKIHEAVEAGEALTNESLARMYGQLLREYYGHDQGVCRIDELYAYEWAYVPHFYYDFYVFQYVTGMVAATALSRRLLEGGPKALDDYMALLEAGSSDRAIDVLERAGVDLMTSAPFESTMTVMNEIMDEIEALELE